MGKLILAVGGIVITATAFSQIISPEIYQSEEDLREALQLGEITFDQYVELVDLMRQRLSENRLDSQLITEIPDLDYGSLDSADAEAEQRISNFVGRQDETESKARAKIVLQHKQRISEESQPESYLRIEAGEGKWKFYLESENEENENRIRRRALEFSKPLSWRAVLGNFQPRFGLGVNVGYRTYLNFSSENSLEAENTLLFPFWTRYNGVLATIQKRNTGATAFYSQNRFGSYKDQVWAGEFKIRKRHFQIDPIFSYQEISKNGAKYVNRAGSIYSRVFFDRGQIAGELAIAEDKEKGGVLEALWQSRNKFSTHILFWSYGDNFVHPLSGGKALPDYRSIELSDLELTFRSKQTGETGAYFSTLAQINPRSRIDLAYQQWQDGNSFLNKNKVRIGLVHKVKKNLEVRLKQYFEDDNLGASFPEKRTTTLVGTYSFSARTKLQMRLNYRRIQLESGNANSTWDEAIFYLPIKEKMLTKVRVRYRSYDLDGDDYGWDFYFSEYITLTQNLTLLTEFVSKEYQDMDRQDLQVVRLRAEWSL